jgi:LysM repeat protein
MEFRPLARLAAPTSVVGALLVGALATAPAQAAAAADGRRIVSYTVRPGDTATGLAVRYHAWTDELIRLNHLGRDATLYAGERIRIPVVVRRGGSTAHQVSTALDHPRKLDQPRQPKRSYADPSRATVRRMIIETALRHGADRYLALAVSWQESGWQMHHVSHAGAIGAMQVMPDTGTWMSLYAGRRLDLRNTRDNITAGVLLLRVLRDMTHGQRQQLAAYYQGVGSVQRGVLLQETKRYVANVRTIKRMLHHGWNPA